MDERILVSDQQFSLADVAYAGEFIEFEGTNWCVKANGHCQMSAGRLCSPMKNPGNLSELGVKERRSGCEMLWPL